MNKNKSKKRRIILASIAGLLVIVVIIMGNIPPGIADTPAGFKQYYSLYVPMRDGTKIAVRVHLPPKLEKGETVPTIMEATRYRTDYKHTFALNLILRIMGENKMSPGSAISFNERGYALVEVEGRGSSASFGSREVEWSRDEILDAGEIIDWIVEQPWSNKRVGIFGISVSGNTAELVASLDNPHLYAAAPLFSEFDMLSGTVMPGGIHNIHLIDNFAESMDLEDTNRDKGFLLGGAAPVDDDGWEKQLKQALAERDNFPIAESFREMTYYDDLLTTNYTGNSLSPFTHSDGLEKSEIPLYIRVGWMDAGTVDGALERFLSLENNQEVHIGPWNHGARQIYDPFLKDFTSPGRTTLIMNQDFAMTDFFDPYLKDGESENDPMENTIYYYTMGEGVWKETQLWPLPEDEGFIKERLYFHGDGSLSRNKPESETEKLEYTVDYTANTGETNRWRTNLGAGDIAYPDRAEEDNKLLTFTSDPLTRDMEITGNPLAQLHFTSTKEDGAFYVYLEAISPEGKVYYITEGLLRALHRRESEKDIGKVTVGSKQSFLKEDGELLIPGEQTSARIGLYATSVLLKKDWRLRVAVAGHDASNFIRIPETGTPVITVETNRNLSSYLEVPVKMR